MQVIQTVNFDDFNSPADGHLPQVSSDPGCLFQSSCAAGLPQATVGTLKRPASFSAPHNDSPEKQKTFGVRSQPVLPLWHTQPKFSLSSPSRPLLGADDDTPTADSGRSHAKWAVWDKELASQGRHGRSTQEPPISSHCSQPEEDSDFASRIKVGSHVKFFDKSILNYDTEGIMGVGVFIALRTTATVLAKGQLQRDVGALVFMSFLFLIGFHFTGGEFSQGSAAHILLVVPL